MTQLSQKIMIEEIQKLKKKNKNAIILAHNYQLLEVQKVADFTGDSLQLAKKAAEIDTDLIVFCGVKFMAETAKLLNPRAKVLLSHPDAGCPMADMITGEQLKEFKAQYPGAVVVCYVNSSIGVKAESDICCTSSNAVQVLKSISPDKKILFVPDQNLGTYAARQAKREVTVWQGYCNVHHHLITLKDVADARKNYPGYKLVVHPECDIRVTEQADFAASTKGMADYVKDNDKVILGTEIGLIKMLKDLYPKKQLVALSERATCINMKKTSLREVLLCLLEEKPEINIEPEIAQKAILSIDNMLKI